MHRIAIASRQAKLDIDVLDFSQPTLTEVNTDLDPAQWLQPRHTAVWLAHPSLHQQTINNIADSQNEDVTAVIYDISTLARFILTSRISPDPDEDAFTMQWRELRTFHHDGQPILDVAFPTADSITPTRFSLHGTEYVAPPENPTPENAP